MTVQEGISSGIEAWPRKRFSMAVAAVVALSIFAYAGSLTGLKIWDDYFLIGGSAIGGGRSLAKCFTEPFLGFYYRPVVSASFWLDLRLWGQTPFYFHQTNVLLHAATTLALVGLALAAFRSRAVALLAGALFAVQPAQISTVAWIGGRTDSLCALFVTLFAWALITAAHTAGRKRHWAVVGATLAYTAALFTKEQMLAALPLAPLAFWAFQPREADDRSGSAWRAGWLATIPMTVASGIYVMLWGLIGPPRPIAPSSSVFEVFGRALRTTTYYGELLVTPTPASMHTLTLNRFEQVGVWPLATGFGLVALIVYAAWRWRKTERPAFWMLSLVVLTLLPVSNLIPLPSLLVAPYRAGVTGLASCVLIAWLLVGRLRQAQLPTGRGGDLGERAKSADMPGLRQAQPPGLAGILGLRQAQPPGISFGRVRVVLAGGLVLWCAGLTVWGCQQWSSAETIFRTVVRYDPASIVGRYNLTTALLETKDPKKRLEAINHLQTALALLYGDDSWRNADSAVKAFRSNPAIRDRVRTNQGNRVEPEEWLSELFSQLGFAKLDSDQLAEAHAAFGIGEALNASNANAHSGLGSCFYLEGDKDEARRHLEKAVAIKPLMAEAHSLLGEIYTEQGNWNRAARAFANCTELQPYLGRHYVMLAGALLELRDWSGAEAAAQEALRRDPKRADATELLAKIRKARSADGRHERSTVALAAGTHRTRVER